MLVHVQFSTLKADTAKQKEWLRLRRFLVRTTAFCLRNAGDLFCGCGEMQKFGGELQSPKCTLFLTIK